MKILVCRPDHFSIDYSINPWMNVENGIDKPLALQQWENLVGLMRSLGAEVVEMQGEPNLPDLVFTANAGLFFIDSQTCILSNFKHPERQPEREFYKKWFEDNGYATYVLANNIIFEGAGDALFQNTTGSTIHKDNILYLGFGFRSQIYDGWMAYRGIYNTVKLVDPYFYHLDTCFCPLKDDYALIWPNAFDEKHLHKFDHLELLKVPEEDAKKFACNAICLGNKVIIPSGCEGTKKLLTGAGFEVYDTDMSEYIKSGGACKCLTLRLS